MTQNRVRTSRIRFSWVLVEDLVFLVYMCATTGHQRDVGIDPIIVRISFAMYIATIIPHLFHGIRINGYFKWLCLFYANIALSCLWADPRFSYFYLNHFIQIFVIAFGLSQRIRTTEDVKRYITIYYLAILYMVVILYIKSPATEWGTQELGEAIGLWRNGLGLNAASGFVISLYFTFGNKNQRVRVINIFIMIVFAIVAIVSTSRKALMMVPIGLVLYWLFYQKRRFSQVRNVAITIVGISLFVVIFWIGARYVMGSDLQIARRMDAVAGVMLRGEVSKDSSYDQRQYYIGKAQELFLQHPIAGVGSNGFAAYMNEINYHHVAYCHNNFWELLSTLGIIGFLIFYYMQAKCLYYARPWNKDVQHTRAMTTALWVLLAMNVVFGWWYVYYCSVSNNFVLTLIYLVCYANHALPETKRLVVRTLGKSDE